VPALEKSTKEVSAVTLEPSPRVPSLLVNVSTIVLGSNVSPKFIVLSFAVNLD
jgi:hypothetical protein